jgi:hypothetical protein
LVEVVEELLTAMVLEVEEVVDTVLLVLDQLLYKHRLYLFLL